MRSPSPSGIGRRRLLLSIAGLAFAGAAQAAAPPALTVYKTPFCTCCGGWVTHMRKAGFQVRVVEQEDLAPVRARFKIPFNLSSCHTGEIAGYGIEGHVPAADVVKLLREKPKALALLVPGMPLGSPGMETRTGQREPYESLLLLDAKGRTKPFVSHT